ncbi:hypothetical protein As57867_022280, partial [Aphanomyces stellatus]
EGVRTAAAGVALLTQVLAAVDSPATASFGPAYVVVVSDVLRHYAAAQWFHALGGPYVDVTLRCVCATASTTSHTPPALAFALATLLDTIAALATGSSSCDPTFATTLLVAATTHLTAYPSLVHGVHDRVSAAWAARLVASDATDADRAALLRAARPLATQPWYAQRVGAAVVRLLHDADDVSAALVDEIETWLTLLLAAMAPAHAEECLLVVLPTLLRVPRQDAVGRMLIGYATAFSASFKGAVGHLCVETRSALEVALRQALVDKQVAAAQRATAQPAAMNLDLSRYG